MSSLIPSLVAALAVATFASSAHANVFEFDRALGRPAWQTTTGFGGTANRAVDGNTDGTFADNSVTHTELENQPYWEVDLGGSHLIDTLEIYNRTDCCKDRLSNVFVFFSNSPMNLRGASDTFQQDGVDTRMIWGQADDRHVISYGKRARYVRIQLADSGYLSLAEVRALEHLTVDGPAAFAAATTWVATGVHTPANAFTLVDVDGALQSIQQGSDGRVHIARDVATDAAVPGSPLVTADAPAVAVDPASNRLFVAARGVDGSLYVGTADPPNLLVSTRTWTWETLAATDAPPSLIVADKKVVVAWLQAAHVRSTWRPADGSAGWDTPTVHIDATTPPTLASNKSNAIGMGFLRWDGSINFIQGTIDTAAHWGGVKTITGWSNGGRVGVVGWGDLFVVSALGGDARPYVAIQQDGGAWNGFEPAWGAADVKLMEAPTLSMFDGALFVFGRDQNKALRYWMRNPNTRSYRYSAGQMWLGGRIVSGYGTGATPPAVAAVGSSTVWGIYGSPSEYFVATRGIGDQQIYALNFSRFVALDVLTGQFGITLRGNASVPDLDIKFVQNLFEHMVAFLALPGANAWTTVNHNPSCASWQWSVALVLNPDTAGQTHANECAPFMYLNSSYQQAFYMFHEWMHMDHARRGLASWTNYSSTFGNPAPKQCTTDAQCGSDKCIDADDQFGWFDDATIRRWMGTKVCAVDDRPQGHIDYYALESAEHEFIETAMRYRFYGELLRTQALHDYYNYNPRLWNMYVWLRDHYFDGIEYTGDGDTGGVKANKNLGWWAMPMR